MRFLTLTEVLDLHGRVVDAAGGVAALRDLGALQSAVAQPRTSFEGAELYPTLEEKATALMFSLVQNHPFVDGNKRVGHAAAEAFLMLNGCELVASVDESERLVVDLPQEKSHAKSCWRGFGRTCRPYKMKADAQPSMRMQMTRPRDRWWKAGRPSNTSLQLIRDR